MHMCNLISTCFVQYLTTVKFLNFRTPEKFAVTLIPKNHSKKANSSVFRQKDANAIANSVDPDQTAPLGAV